MHATQNKKLKNFTFSVNSTLKLNDTENYHLLWSNISDVDCLFNFEHHKVPKNSLIIVNPNDVFIGKSHNEDAFKLVDLHNYSNPVLKLLNRTRLFEESLDESIVEVDPAKATEINNYFDPVNQTLTTADIHTILLDILTIKFNSKYALAFELESSIEANYKVKHAVADYAKELNMTPKALLTQMIALGLKKPSDLIKEHLLLEAKKSLVFSTSTVKEICYDLGFDDPAYFARFFKRNVGLTALNFRSKFFQQD